MPSPPSSAIFGGSRPLGPVLYYLPTFVRDHGFPAEGWPATGEPFRLYDTLDAAEAAAVATDGQLGRVLVLDGDHLTVRDGGTAHVPRAAVKNVDIDGDYWRPAPIEAGGGFVVRRGEDGGVDLLLIFRRGAWDIPKGKLDDGETPREAAHREVAEEVGIKRKKIAVGASLGTTIHGYPWARHEVYAIKTTHWYAMTTTATKFKPEKREGIEAVAFVPWAEAVARVGFPSLRDHLAGLDPEALLGEG